MIDRDRILAEIREMGKPPVKQPADITIDDLLREWAPLKRQACVERAKELLEGSGRFAAIDVYDPENSRWRRVWRPT